MTDPCRRNAVETEIFLDICSHDVYNTCVMRSWRNRHTRTFEGRVGDRTGSSPVDRTQQKSLKTQRFRAFFLYLEMGGLPLILPLTGLYYL